MKLGIVGTGMIAQIVGPFLNEWGCTVEAVAGTPGTVDQARDLAQKCGAAKAYATYDEMLADSDIDTVYLAVPNFLHHPFAKQALEAGKNVIVEKPFCTNAREAEELASLARERDLMLFEAISTVHLPNFARLRELLPRIGTIKIATVNYSQYSSRYDKFRAGEVLPAFDPAKAGGALMDLGLYNLHYLIGLFGAPKKATYLANVERGIDTSGVTTLDYGAFKAVSVAAKDCAAPIMNVIEGTDGYLLQTTPANNCGEITLHLNDGTEEHFNDNPPLQWESEFRAFARMIAEHDAEGRDRHLDHSLTVARVMTEARLGAGVEFPADEVEA